MAKLWSNSSVASLSSKSFLQQPLPGPQLQQLLLQALHLVALQLGTGSS